MRALAILSSVLVVVGAARGAASSGKNTGVLTVETPGLVLKLSAGPSHVMGKDKEVPVPPCRKVPMPAGSYKGTSAELFAKDRAGKLWSLEAKEELGKLAAFDILPDQTTTLKGGGPLQLKISVTVESGATVSANDLGMSSTGMTLGRPDGSWRFAFVRVRYVGQAGEAYFPRAKMANRPMPSAVIRILDEQGKVMGKAHYERGGIQGVTLGGTVESGREGCMFPIPPGFPGRIRVKVEQDLGPFKVEPEKEEDALHDVSLKKEEAKPADK